MKPRYFLVYRSVSHSYLRTVLILLPLLMLYLALDTQLSFLFFVTAGVLIICFPFLAMLFAILRVDSRGVHLLRLFRRSISLVWEDIHFHGELCCPYLGSSMPAQLYYVSRQPVSPSTVDSNALPKLTTDFLYATMQPMLAETIAYYCKK